MYFYQLDMCNCEVLVHDSLLNMNRQFCKMQFIEHIFFSFYICLEGERPLVREANY